MIIVLCPCMQEQIFILLEKTDGLMNRVSLLEKEVSRLNDVNQGLSNRLAKYETPKNSQNSSCPPSSDFPKPQKTQSLREPSGKKPGGQLGHEGTTLMMASALDITEYHLPFYCTCCGEDLSVKQSIFAGNRHTSDSTSQSSVCQNFYPTCLGLRSAPEVLTIFLVKCKRKHLLFTKVSVRMY